MTQTPVFGINAKTQIRPGTITPELLHPNLVAQLSGAGQEVPAEVNVTYLSPVQSAAVIERLMNGDETLTDQHLLSLLDPTDSQTTTFAEGDTFAFYGPFDQNTNTLWIATRQATGTWQVVVSPRAQFGEQYFWVRAEKGSKYKVGLFTLNTLFADVNRSAVEQHVQKYMASLLYGLTQLTESLYENNSMRFDYQPQSSDRQTFTLSEVVPVGQIAVNVNGVRLARSQYVYDVPTKTITLNEPIGEDDVLTVDFYGHDVPTSM